MTERWVRATYSTHEDADLNPALKGTPCWVNIALALRVTNQRCGTYIEFHGREMGPFNEYPEHFHDRPVQAG